MTSEQLYTVDTIDINELSLLMKEYYAMMSSFMCRIGHGNKDETMQFIRDTFNGEMLTKYLSFYHADVKKMARETLEKSMQIRMKIEENNDEANDSAVIYALDSQSKLLKHYAL